MCGLKNQIIVVEWIKWFWRVVCLEMLKTSTITKVEKDGTPCSLKSAFFKLFSTMIVFLPVDILITFTFLSMTIFTIGTQIIFSSFTFYHYHYYYFFLKFISLPAITKEICRNWKFEQLLVIQALWGAIGSELRSSSIMATQKIPIILKSTFWYLYHMTNCYYEEMLRGYQDVCRIANVIKHAIRAFVNTIRWTHHLSDSMVQHVFELVLVTNFWKN